MFRALIYGVLFLFILAVIRLIMSTLRQGVGELFREEAAAAKRPSGSGAANPPPAGSSGSLKRDPVCGTYVPADNSVRKTVGGEVVYFCSPECRDKYVV